MQNPTFGLSSAFKAITSKALLRQLCERYAPSLSLDWDTSLKKLPDTLAAACKVLRNTSPKEHSDLVCVLQEISSVATDRKSPVRLASEIREPQLSTRFEEVLHSEGRHLQNCAVWILLNAPRTWEHLLIAARSLSIHAKTVEDYDATDAATPDNNKLQELESAFTAYLSSETLHGDHVHVEVDEGDEVMRYFVSINSFPMNVQQFDDNGNYAIARDANAINFMIEYLPATGRIRLKCPLTASKRRELVRIFADKILSSAIREKSKTSYDLSRHMKGQVLPKPNHPLILSARLCGLTVEYTNQKGLKDSLAVTTESDTNLPNCITDFFKVRGIAVNDATVAEVEYEIKLDRSPMKAHTVHASIDTDGFHFICRDTVEREIIRNYLKEVVA